MTATYFVQDHVIFRFPADAMVRLATTRTCTEDDTRRYANIILIVIPASSPCAASLTTCAVAMKNALFRAIKISEFSKWVERHNGDHVNHVTSDDVTGDPKVAQPSRVHATKSVALATRMHLGRCPVTRRVASQCECRGAPARVNPCSNHHQSWGMDQLEHHTVYADAITLCIFNWYQGGTKSCIVQQGKSEGFESCDRPIVRKRPIWVKIGDVLYLVTLKFDGWPWKTIGHLSFAVSSFVQHFIAIGEFKLELQSWNAQFGSNSKIFRAVWPRNLMYDLEKQ